MLRKDMPKMIKQLKTKKQEALLAAADAGLTDSEHEQLLSLGEAAGKAALLIEECYIRSARLVAKGLLTEDDDVKLGKGEPVAHPQVPVLPSTKFDYNVWKASLVDKLSQGALGLDDLEREDNTVCRHCGTEGQPVWEGDAEYDCEECGQQNAVVNYFYVVSNDL